MFILPKTARPLLRLCAGAFTDALIAVAVIAQAAIVLSVRYLPYTDTTNNLSRYVLMEQYWFGTPPAYVEVSLRLTNYIGLDLLGVALVHFFSVQVAARVLALLSALAPGIGMYLLLWATCPGRRGWALVGVLLGFNRFFFLGFFNYTVGIGLLLIWLAAYRRVEAQPTPLSLIALGGCGIVLAVVHLSTIIILAVILATNCLFSTYITWRTVERTAHIRSALVALVALGPALLIFVALSLLTPTSQYGIIWRSSCGDKIEQLISPFFSISWLEVMVMAGGYLASLAAFLAANRQALRFDGSALAVIALLGLFLIFPLAAKGTHYLDVRFLLPAYLLPFCISPHGRSLGRKITLMVPFLACLSNDVVVYREIHRIDRVLCDYAEALTQVPAGTAVLPLISEPWLGVPIFRHFAHWHVIEGRGRVPGTLAAPETTFYDHFRINTPALYAPELDWGFRKFTPLDGNRIAHDYQYIIHVGDNPRVAKMIESYCRLVARVGKITIYYVTVRSGGRG